MWEGPLVEGLRSRFGSLESAGLWVEWMLSSLIAGVSLHTSKVEGEEEFPSRETTRIEEQSAATVLVDATPLCMLVQA